MFALFLTLLSAEISWTAGKYLILESFLLQYRWISGEYLPPRALDATLSQEFVAFWQGVFSTLTDTDLKGNNFLIIKKTIPWWYWLMSIVDCHLLSISSIGYPGLLEIKVCGTTEHYLYVSYFRFDKSWYNGVVLWLKWCVVNSFQGDENPFKVMYGELSKRLLARYSTLYVQDLVFRDWNWKPADTD